MEALIPPETPRRPRRPRMSGSNNARTPTRARQVSGSATRRLPSNSHRLQVSARQPHIENWLYLRPKGVPIDTHLLCAPCPEGPGGYTNHDPAFAMFSFYRKNPRENGSATETGTPYFYSVSDIYTGACSFDPNEWLDNPYTNDWFNEIPSFGPVDFEQDFASGEVYLEWAAYGASTRLEVPHDVPSWEALAYYISGAVIELMASLATSNPSPASQRPTSEHWQRIHPAVTLPPEFPQPFNCRAKHFVNPSDGSLGLRPSDVLLVGVRQSARAMTSGGWTTTWNVMLDVALNALVLLAPTAVPDNATNLQSGMDVDMH